MGDFLEGQASDPVNGFGGEGLAILLEAERRGLPIPQQKAAALAEARRRGLVPPASGPSVGRPGLSFEQELALAAAKAKRAEFEGGNSESPDIANMRLPLAERVARAKAGTLQASPESAARHEDMNAAALAQMQGPGHAGGMSGHATQGALLGFGDEYLAGLSALAGVQPDGQGGANWFDYSKPIGERYNTALGAIREELGVYQDQNPGKALTAQVAGAIVGPGKGSAGFVNAGTSTATRVGRGAVAGAGTSAAYGFGDGEGGAWERAVNAAWSAPIGLATGGALIGAGQGFSRAAEALKSKFGDKVPGLAVIDELRGVADRLYAEASRNGASVPERRIKAMVRTATARLNKAGFDPGLHPRVQTVLNRLNSETGDKTLSQMEILRRVAGNAAASLQPDEKRIAGILIDTIDDVASKIGGSKTLVAARATWAKVKKLEMVESAVERASLADNVPAALQSEFRRILKSPKLSRGLTKAERAAMAKMTRAVDVEKGLRHLGQILSLKGNSGLPLAAAAGYATNPIAGFALPLVGVGARAMAKRVQKSKLENVREVVAGRPPMARNALAATVAAPNAVDQQNALALMR